MTVKQKAKQLASTLVSEQQNPEPLIDLLAEMADWQKQQILKGALNGKAILDDEGLHLIVPALNTVTRTLDDGDKFKVLIIKED